MPGYPVPTLTYEHEGEEYEFRADLNVYSWISETLITEPYRFTAIYNDKGVAVDDRLICERENIVDTFRVFGRACHPTVSWDDFTDSLPPKEAILLWTRLNALLAEAGIAGNESNDPKD